METATETKKKSNQIPSVAHFFWLHFGVAFDIAFEAIHYKKLSHFIIIQPKHTHILSTTLCRSLELHAPMWCDTYTDTHTLTQTNRHKSRCIIFASLKTIYLFYIKSGPEQNNKKILRQQQQLRTNKRKNCSALSAQFNCILWMSDRMCVCFYLDFLWVAAKSCANHLQTRIRVMRVYIVETS